MRRTSFGSTYTPAPRQSGFGLGSGGSKFVGLGSNSSIYKRRRSILKDFSDDESGKGDSDSDDARSLTAQFEENDAFEEESSGVEKNENDGWVSDRDHSTKIKA